MKTIYTFVTLLLMTVSLSAQVSVDEPAVCLQCHGDIEELFDKKDVHGAFESGECSSCHNPHASKHASLLADNVNELCIGCHEIEIADKSFSIHEPIQTDNCLGCHTPHAGDHSLLLSTPKNKLCVSCHSEAENWKAQPVIHDPVAKNDCASCHDPHSSQHDALLSDGIPALCFTCHQVNSTFITAHGNEAISETNCITCHDPHASTGQKLVMTNQHKPFATGQCISCHTKENDQVTFAVKDETEPLCLKCHKSVTKHIGDSRHIATDEKACLNCHNPHASKGEALILTSQQSACMSCHFNENMDKPKAAYMTHPENVCSDCHIPHGNNEEQYLKADKIQLCLECHADAHKGSHPVGEGVIDPRDKSEVNCLSCHQLHGADFEKYLPLDPTMDLCIQCHKK